MNLFLGGSVSNGLPVFDSLPWRADATAACGVAHDILVGEPIVLATVRAYVESLTSADRARLLERSSEKTTHYKWYLGGGSSYRMWLHEYKPPRVYATASAHAASIHNHRYSFTSRVLAGALHTKSFAVSAGDLVEVGHNTLRSGRTLLLSADDVHQIFAVEPHTYTLVVQGPAEKHHSCVWDAATGAKRLVYDLEHLLTELPSRLVTQAQDGNAA